MLTTSVTTQAAVNCSMSSRLIQQREPKAMMALAGVRAPCGIESLSRCTRVSSTILEHAALAVTVAC